MPFINVSTSATMTDEQKIQLKSRIGASISILATKTEARLMVKIEDACDMYFGGVAKDKIAFVEVRLFRESDFEEKKKFTEEVFKALNEILAIDSDDIFLSITEHFEWGAGGTYKSAN